MGTWRPLVDGQILDCGYNELMVTPAFADELLAGGMRRVNGREVRVQVVDRLPAVNAVIVRWQAVEQAEKYPAGTYAWQAAA